MPEDITAPLIPILKMILSDVLMPLFMFSVVFSFAFVIALVIVFYEVVWHIRNAYRNVIKAILRRESVARDKLITWFIYGDHRALYAVAVFMAIVLMWFVINLG